MVDRWPVPPESSARCRGSTRPPRHCQWAFHSSHSSSPSPLLHSHCHSSCLCPSRRLGPAAESERRLTKKPGRRRREPFLLKPLKDKNTQYIDKNKQGQNMSYASNEWLQEAKKKKKKMESIRSWNTQKFYFKQSNNEKQERALTKSET